MALNYQLAWAPPISFPSFIGQVASRCRLPNSTTGSGPFNFQTFHRAFSPIPAIKVAYPNWWVQVSGGVGETSQFLGTLTLRAGVEYPIGSGYTQLLYSGNANGVAAAGNTLWSDMTPLITPIPAGALFSLRPHVTSTGNIPFSDSAGAYAYGPAGDGVEASGTDKSLSGIIAAAGTNVATFFPAAIVARTSQPSVVVNGDSRCRGEGDLTGDSTGHIGQIARALGDVYPMIDISISGATVGGFADGGSSYARRLALMEYATHQILALGVNDRAFGTASILADLQTVAGLLSPRKCSVCTIPPASSGAWVLADGSDQTASFASEIGGVNTTLLTRPAWITGELIDLATQMALNGNPSTGKWRAGYTSDGLHQNTTGYTACTAAAALVLAAADYSAFMPQS